MGGSVAVALRTAIIDGLAAHFATLDDFNGTTDASQRLEVAYGYEMGSSAAERLFCGRSRAETPSASMRAGRNYRNEAGTFDLIALVSFVGGSPEEAETRAAAVGEVVETWLADRKNNELGVTGLIGVHVAGWEMNHLGNDRGHMAELIIRVEWTARLT